MIETSPSVLHVLTSRAWGGLELYATQLVQRMAETGQKTGLYCIAGSRVEQEALKQNKGFRIYHGIRQARVSIADILRLRRIIKEGPGFNIIHSHTRQDVWLVSLALQGLRHKKHVYSLYMSAPGKKDLLHRFVYGRIDAVVSSSEILNALVRQNYPVSSRRVHLIRYGRNFPALPDLHLQGKNLRSKYGASAEDIIIGTLCRIDPGKGLRELAEALLLLPEHIKKRVKIWMVGEPTLAHTDAKGAAVYETEAKSLNDWLVDFAARPEAENRLVLIPFQDDPNPVLQAFDVFVLPTYKETYSLAVLDAMGKAKPVIGTNTGGTIEQIQHNTTGLLVSARDPQALANAISFYVTHPDLRVLHGEEGQKWVKNAHDWQTAIEKLKGLYTNLLTES